MKTHDISPSFSSEECNFQDIREENVLNHRIAKHSKYTCDNCDFHASVDDDLKKHKQQVHGKQTQTCFQCDDCEFSDNVEENVLNHKIVNQSKNICEMCEFESNDTQKLGEHIQIVHQHTKFTYNMCPSSLKTSSTLHDHRKSQHRHAYFPCDH